MADITPVTREEFYLAKAGGQDVPVPSAVTREEHYLEKLSNDNVVVPSPVTRREKFLYFACGGEIDLPSEERMTRLERLIAKAGGMDVTTPTAITRLEKFWANVEGGWTVTTLTGTLPITFRSNGTALINYRIYGTADGAGVQTENLFDGNYESAFINTATNTYQPLANGRTALIKCEPDTDYTITRWEGGNRFIVADFPQMPVSGDSANILASYTTNLPTNLTIHTNVDAAYFVAYISSVGGDPVVSIVKGSTAVPYEPYGYKLPLTVTSGTESKDTDIYIGDSKLGAEEYVDYEEQKVYKRTENLFDPDNAEFVYGYFGAGSPISAYNTNTRISFIICEPSTTYTVCKTLSARFSVSWSESEPTNGVAIYGNIYENDATNITITTGATAKYLVFYYFHASYDTLTEQEIRDSIMIVKGSTPPETYIPYLQPVDPPLPFPAIETFNGENTLDSTEALGEVTIKGRIKEAE